MKTQRYATVGAILALALILVGCQKPPAEEQNSTRAALDSARPAAEKWAPNEWRDAQTAYDEAGREIETQNNRFALMRNYDKAKQMLADAKSKADRALQAGNDNKEQARKEAEAKIAEAETSINDAKAALETVPKTKDTKADLELFQSDLDGLTTSLNDARNMMAQEAYREAAQKAESTKTSAMEIKTKLDEAAAKVAARRGRRK
jgi:hypothetical protein